MFLIRQGRYAETRTCFSDESWVFCNVSGRDLAACVGEIQMRTKPIEERLRDLPGDTI